MSRYLEELKTDLAYIELDLQEIYEEELQALEELAKEDVKVQKKIDQLVILVERELSKINPNLYVLEKLKLDYEKLLLDKYEIMQQYLIGRETIAQLELEY